MRVEASVHIPRPRTLVHPGRSNPVRIQRMCAASARHVRLSLRPGASLHDALVDALHELGIRSASTTILGGMFKELYYCVAPPDVSRNAVIAYSQPIRTGGAYMIFGNATVGFSTGGAPLVHCHATVCAQQAGVRGGHIIPQQSIVGRDPITVLVTSLDGFDLQQAFDAETNIALLQPIKGGAYA